MRSRLSRALDSHFALASQGTNVRTEILAGVTTFLTMAYITFANPAMLSDAGMDFGAVFVATCLAAAIGTAIMGLYANYPVALAPGMGLNAFFSYGVVQGMGHSWQVALGAVFVSGVLFVILSLLPVREWIIDSIPKTMKLAISAGVGLFLGIIALRNAGLGLVVTVKNRKVGRIGVGARPGLIDRALGVHPMQMHYATALGSLIARSVPAAAR